ncbi:DnaJ domain-containing protein [Collinsella sp. zg1085]|nr:DnaJ domain-containing protein [Collinsella sp. zg1085]
MNQKDYYALLGVASTATKKEIQKAFQKKARTLHPDVNKAPDAEAQFKEVSEAYAVLSDDQKRARYDALRAGNPFAGYSNTAPSSAGGAYTAGGFGAFPFGFPFDMAHSNRPRSSAYHPEHGADVVIELELSHEEAQAGVTRTISYQRFEPCDACQGSGSVATEHARRCPTCNGMGSIAVDLSFLFGSGAAQMQCPECEGSGQVVADPCPACTGSGRQRHLDHAQIHFEANTHDGDVVRLPAKGNAGTNGAGAGDFVIRAHVAAERLDARARMGFGMIGVALPFLVLAMVSGSINIFSIVSMLPLIYGVVSILSSRPHTHTSLWWRRGAQTLVQGMSNSLIWA